jgi:glutamate synthase (NADPH/NADH) large chain
MNHDEHDPRSATEAERHHAARDGLYRPDTERDACGVAFVATLERTPSHAVIEQALTVLENLEHRGGVASDPQTGDGAGVLVQIPHALLEDECKRLGIPLPAAGTYGLGMLFLPRDPRTQQAAKHLIERIVDEEGQFVLGWRAVPTNPDVAGASARATMPAIAQVLIGPGTLTADDHALDRKLYVIRKRIEHESRALDIREGEYPYIASLSTRTVVYKGLLTPYQLPRFFSDLGDPRAKTTLALVHQRFSTNTFPSWSRAHPYRRIAHNGEINTLRGNVGWMAAREPSLRAPVFGEDVRKLSPVIDETGSDSSMFDDVLELLVHTGRSLPHAVMMMIPEAWQNHATMSAERRAFYEYHACVMEPWDGPACIAFTDGRYVGAVLDRNGLRPARYTVTRSGLVVMASEAGVLDFDPEQVERKDRLRPGRMFLVDTHEGRVVDDEEIKRHVCERRPWGVWLERNLLRLGDLSQPTSARALLGDADRRRHHEVCGYTREDLARVIVPMCQSGEEPVGSMGNDTPPAPLSAREPLLWSYFRQQFAQVTNPPIDPIREALVMSLVQTLGSESNLFEESPQHCRKLEIDSPILTDAELATLKGLDRDGLRTRTVNTLFNPKGGREGLEGALARIGAEAERAVRDGATLLVLSDRGIDSDHAPVPALLALGAVNAFLIEKGVRHRCGIIVESAEVREVAQCCLLVSFGAGAVVPWLAYDTIAALVRDHSEDIPHSREEATAKFKKALEKGLLKVMSKMGISTVQSYRGARIFECIGLDARVVERYFPGIALHLAGAVGLDELAHDARHRHERAYAKKKLDVVSELLPSGGRYQYRRDGEHHAWNPETLGQLQHAVRSANYDGFKKWARKVDDETHDFGAIRGLLDFVSGDPIPLDEVESELDIVKRFRTGAMSFGSISQEAHETLAIAMNRIGARSNTGEGGEDPARFQRDANGDSRRSAIKQVASGRFGVTIEYLVNADEIQIKVAQGAKPGEGGQLPGHKVDAYIAKTRHATAGVGLISPPPHHDIYSIEDLAQLIFDLKNANPMARVSVKLVAEAGVGTIAAGVAKARADHILISGDSGGTGASPLTSVYNAGIPWEIGLSEAQQVLSLNGLRGRVRLETDGQLKTARDVAVAALLGAEEFGFGTAALVTLGCVMMRACHLNTCPVGIATQDPRLRARFAGQPEHAINYFVFVARQLRELMAELGFRTVDAMIGRVDRLRGRALPEGSRAARMDLSKLLFAPSTPGPRRNTGKQEHEIELALDTVLVEQCRPALERREQVEIEMPIRNVHRATCTLLSSHVARKHGSAGLPDATIRLHFKGSAGQSFGAFLAPGIDATLEGEANDGFGKGLSGGRLVVFPAEGSKFAAEENVIIGNAALYGATSGEAFVRGVAGERFAVRNSGAVAVIEGCGDHGCEYMTGGRVVVLGATGRNFAAGMSGGIAYVLDGDGALSQRVNAATVALDPLDAEDLNLVRGLVHKHYQRTMSAHGWRVLSGWRQWSRRFVKVIPHEYKRVLADGAHTISKGGA